MRGLVLLAGAGGVAAVLETQVGSPSGKGKGPVVPPAPKLESEPNVIASPGASVSGYLSAPALNPPRVLVDVDKPTRDSGVIFTECHGGQQQEGALLLDADGGLVWFKPVSTAGGTGRRAFNVRAQIYKGQPVLTYFEGVVFDQHGLGDYHILDTQYRLIKTVRARHGPKGDLHDFLITPEDTALFTSYGEGFGDLTAVGGQNGGPYFYGEVQEVDIESGELLFYWRSDRHVAFEESYNPFATFEPWDYFHLNSINIDPLDGNLIISSRMCWTVYKVDRKTGEVIWRLGGKKNDFEIGPGAHFAWQHDVTPQGNGIFTLFDNEGLPRRTVSRGLVLQVDETKRRASLVDQYLHDPPIFSGVLGSVQDLPSGHRLVGWGTSTYITEYGPVGEVLFDAHLDGSGVLSYRAFKYPWSAVPATPPAVVVRREAMGTTAYVSWNGATEVDRWLVSGGKSPHALSVIGSAKKRGFETAIKVPKNPAYVQLAAVDSSGHLLRRSHVVKVL